MAQGYDKIIKENIEEVILPLANKLLRIYPTNLEEIPDDLQITIERRPDFLKKVVEKGETYILLLEFQVVDDPTMLSRMLEYFALLFRKYQLPVKQYVFYIGTVEPVMQTELELENLSFHFGLQNLRKVDYHQFVTASKPEEVLLAVLSDFGDRSPKEVITDILVRLRELTPGGIRLGKYAKQLEILSKLRNLQEETIQQIENMAIVYDLQSDVRFLQGIEKGVEKSKIEAIRKLLADSVLSVEQIAKYFEVSEELVMAIQKELKKD